MHDLVAEWQHGRVSRMDLEMRRCTLWWRNGGMGGSAGWTLTETRRHTSWWRDGSTEGSAGWTWARGQDNARTSGRTVAQEG